MTMMTKSEQYAAIEKHGRDLLAIFPKATEQDPVKLCKKLRRLEAKGHALALRACNGPGYDNEDDEEKLTDALLVKVNALLGNVGDLVVPIFVNLDARGYALKIDSDWMRDAGGTKLPPISGPVTELLHRDWGGYGIIAPEIC